MGMEEEREVADEVLELLNSRGGIGGAKSLYNTE